MNDEELRQRVVALEEQLERTKNELYEIRYLSSGDQLLNGGDVVFRSTYHTDNRDILVLRPGLGSNGGRDGAIRIESSNGDLLVEIHSDGTTNFGDKYDATHAALVFWRVIASVLRDLRARDLEVASCHGN